MMSTAVSILIPTYNRASFLPQTLDSLLSQRRPAAEIIVIDDGSTDNTGEVLSRYRSHVRYQRVPNGRVCRARNIAASLAQSPFFAFCDSDDQWHDDKLAEQMELHASHPELRYSFTNFHLVTRGKRSLRTKFDDIPAGLFTPSLTESTVSFVHHGPMLEQILQFQPIFPSTVVVRRDLFKEIGGFNEALGATQSEDLEFTLRCVRQGPIGVIRRAVVDILKHEANFSGDEDAVSAGEIEILEYTLAHYDYTEATRALVVSQIALRHMDLAWGAFRREEFDRCAALLSRVPRRHLDRHARARLVISRLPKGVAGVLKKLTVRN